METRAHSAVRLIDHTANGDLMVVNAARASFGKLKQEFDPERDPRLIEFLAKHKHTSPFYHPHITLLFEVPIFVARQLMRHHVGISYNEVSRRYVDAPPDFYRPKYWRKRAPSAKQGSLTEGIARQRDADFAVTQAYERALESYFDLLNMGVAPEQARMVLPQSMMTSYIATFSLYALANMVKLRTDPHAQIEVQEVAAQVNEIMRTLADYRYSWSALMRDWTPKRYNFTEFYNELCRMVETDETSARRLWEVLYATRGDSE